MWWFRVELVGLGFWAPWSRDNIHFYMGTIDIREHNIRSGSSGLDVCYQGNFMHVKK